MTEEEIRRIVLGLLGEIAPEARLDELVADKPFQEQLDLDSMDFLNFVSGLAQQTGIEVPERDYQSIASLDGCVHYVSRHPSGRS